MPERPASPRRPRARSLGMLLPALALSTLATLPAQAAGQAPGGAAATATAPYDESLFQALDFRLVGPFRGGRSTAVTGVPGQPGTFYMGSTGGGVWKTTDGGISWHNVSDRVRADKPAPPATVMGEVAPGSALSEFFAATPAKPAPTRERPGDAFGTASVGAIAVAPSDPNVVYVGMGSACIRGNVSPGDGVYKSTDGGETWHHLGLARGADDRQDPHPPQRCRPRLRGGARPRLRPQPRARRLPLHRRRPHLGAKCSSSATRRAPSTSSWTRPTRAVLYAAIWEALRQPWTLISGGPGSGLYKSIDGGDTWRQLTEGLPAGPLGRIGVALSPADPNRVWALVEAKEKWGVYRSDDGGKSFRQLDSDRNPSSAPGTTPTSSPTPRTPSTVYILNTSVWRSEDGGKTFTPIRTPHGDNHDLWIDPDDPQTMIESNDGGANITFNGGRTWSTQAQPADRRALPGHRRRPVPLLAVRRAAGQHGGRHSQPHPRRRHRPPGLVRPRRLRERLGGGRRQEPARHLRRLLRRLDRPLRPRPRLRAGDHPLAAGGGGSAGQGPALPLPVEPAHTHLAARPTGALHLLERTSTAPTTRARPGK